MSEKENTFSIKDFTNEELLYLYHDLSVTHKKLKEAIDKQCLFSKLPSGHVIVTPISEEQANEIKENTFFQNLSSILEKLEPVIDLIKPTYVKEVNDLIKHFNLNDNET
jgi:hypothetical protein